MSADKVSADKVAANKVFANKVFANKAFASKGFATKGFANKGYTNTEVANNGPTHTVRSTKGSPMKTVFVCCQGVLVEGMDERCTLRSGAAAGLHLLADLDYRIIVIDEQLADSSCEEYAARDQHRERGEVISDRGEVISNRGSAPERRPDNGRRRRRTDAANTAHTAAERNNGSAALHSGIHASALPHMRPGKRAVTPLSEHSSTRSAISTSTRTRTSLLVYRLGDLLFREQLALQGYYSCSHDAPAPHAPQSPQSPHSPASAGAALVQRGQAAKEAPPTQAAQTRSSPCFCKPPQPGLLLQAAFDHGIDLPASWMIGARLDDIEAGNRAGCRTVLIDNGIETVWQLGRSRVPTRIAPDLYSAAKLITQK